MKTNKLRVNLGNKTFVSWWKLSNRRTPYWYVRDYENNAKHAHLFAINKVYVVGKSNRVYSLVLGRFVCNFFYDAGVSE